MLARMVWGHLCSENISSIGYLLKECVKACQDGLGHLSP